MQEVVINTCYGGFRLSHKGIMEYAKRKGIKLYPFIDKRDKNGHLNFKKQEPYTGQKNTFIIHYSTKPLKNGKYNEKSYFSTHNFPRNDSDLIQVVKKLKDQANGEHAKLKIVKIPNKIDFTIEEYDGNEWIAEKHRIWR